MTKINAAGPNQTLQNQQGSSIAQNPNGNTRETPIIGCGEFQDSSGNVDLTRLGREMGAMSYEELDKFKQMNPKCFARNSELDRKEIEKVVKNFGTPIESVLKNYDKSGVEAFKADSANGEVKQLGEDSYEYNDKKGYKVTVGKGVVIKEKKNEKGETLTMKAYKQKGAKDFSTVYTITSKNGNEISIKQNVTGFAGNEYYITERKDGVEITRAYGSWDGNERLDISDEGNQRLDEITVIDLKSGSKMLIDYSGKDIPSSIEIDDL